ncbi:MAG: type IV secretion system DNA-binding domain-containing protein [Candidatus Portnoybacteria bacterium]|nr:type IV secretion system DNA-binding domain-containing protein [Candidatus Portnoybacteria bacterium]
MAEEVTFFAETDFRNQKTKFGIKPDDRRRHTYVIGKTGVGKTTLLENMAIQDIRSGRGVGIVDPHGEFAEKMLNFVPSDRVNDVVYFNPADLDWPIAFNVMEKVDLEHRHLVCSGLVGVFKKIWAETWGPRLEYVLRNAILALLEYPGSTLLGIMRMLVDKDYRQKVVDRVKDPVVRSFWVDEFSKYRGNFEVEAIAPIQNKVGQFLTNPLIRNIVGQTRSAINIRQMMDEGKILIMNLSKGKIGEDASALLGAMLITKVQLAAMSRVDIGENERRDFYLYVDEFQNFATESFATILSEARKYRLNLVLAHQYITQMVEQVRDAVFGNVGTMIVFRVGAADAEFLEKEFSPEFTVNDLVGLGFAQIYLKLMIDGFASRPFSATTLPPFPSEEKSFCEKIIKVSRERYGQPRQEVEDKIVRWSNKLEEEAKASVVDRPAPKRTLAGGSLPIFIDKCSNCGQRVEISFKPDGVRPIYCKNCLAAIRSRNAQTKNLAEEKIKGDPVIKETGQAVSLGEAIKADQQKFSPEKKKKRREVDLSGLRQTLSEVVPAEKKESPQKDDFSGQQEIKPGQTIEF